MNLVDAFIAERAQWAGSFNLVFQSSTQIVANGLDKTTCGSFKKFKIWTTWSRFCGKYDPSICNGKDLEHDLECLNFCSQFLWIRFQTKIL